MLGRFDEARAILAESRAELADRGKGIQLATTTGMTSAEVELWLGDPAAAEFGAEGCGLYEELGEQSFLEGVTGGLAKALYALDRLEEADDGHVGRPSSLRATTRTHRCSGVR